MTTIQKYTYSGMPLLACIMLNCGIWAMELQNIESTEQSAVPTLKALCINVYLKNQQKIDQTKINIPDVIKHWITLYGPLRQETLDEQLRCFIKLNDSKRIEETLQYIPKKTVTALEKIGDFSNGYIRVWSRAYKSNMHAQNVYNTWASDTLTKINQNNLLQAHDLQPIISQERSNYAEQRMKLFFCGRYTFWICCGGICLSGLGALMVATIWLSAD